MNRQVYLKPSWKMHAFGNQMMAYPPDGYEFVTPKTPETRVLNAASRWEIGYSLLWLADRALPTGLIKAWAERMDKASDGTLLTYTWDLLISRPEPWVIEVEYASHVLGGHLKHLRRFKGTLERALASPFCRKIRCWAETGRRSLLADLDVHGFADKIEVVYYAVPPRSFVKEYTCENVKLLFIGSGTSKRGFDYRGGREVLEAFALLRQRHDNLELVVRSDVPPDVRARYSGLPGLTIIDEFISRDTLDKEFKSADIFLLPSHNTPVMNILDAMSYELPVITLDAWANPEYVEDGKTGLVAVRSKKLQYYYQDTAQPNFASRAFAEGIQRPDPVVVQDIIAKIDLLIQDPNLRRQMGKAGRWEVERGKFSLAKMNKKLARLFDSALDGDRR